MGTNFVPFLITTLALSFYFYMTGTTGAVILVILIFSLLALIYFKQNSLLYMPGRKFHNIVIPGVEKSPANNQYGLRHPREHDL